jgi:lysyl-tRNA synthetase, class I
VERAVAYYRDFVRPAKRYRAPTAQERAALEELASYLAGIPEGTDGEAVQHELYEIGKRHGFAQLRDWFRALYEVLLGQPEGPRFGSFVAVYGVADSRALVEQALQGRRSDRAGGTDPTPATPDGSRRLGAALEPTYGKGAA